MHHKSLTISARALVFGLGCLATLTVGCGPSQQGRQASAEHGQLRRGLDGAITVSNPNTILNRYAALGSDALRGSRSITVSTAAGAGLAELQPLAAGDVLLIYQAQGADLDADRNTTASGSVVDIGSAGLFEFVTVRSVDSAAGVIELFGNCGGLRNNYDAAGHTQLVRVPQYTSLTVDAGASVGAAPWNGAVGGVIALRVETEAKLEGTIDATGTGFRGGLRSVTTDTRQPGAGAFYSSPNRLDGGAKGEGIGGFTVEYAQLGAYGRGAAANGGGGGNRIVAGGGGGGNGGALTDWNGQGVMLTSVVGGAQAWPLDPGYDAGRTSFAGGGRGGYTASGAALDPTTFAPDNVLWLQDYRRERGGLGGRPVPNDANSRLFLGGGGGAGDDYQDGSGSGGRGGGLVFLSADAVSGSGRIVTNGNPGGDARSTVSGGGGGGAGGTLVVSARTVSGVGLEARGGGGGSQQTAATQGAGPGGGGGGGFIAAPAEAQTRLVDGGLGGTTASTDLVNFPRNGASDGAAGQSDGVTNPGLGTTQHCVGADLELVVTASPTETVGVEPVTLSLAVQNRGPSAAVNLTLRLRVPPASTLQPRQPDGWDCAISGTELTCERSSLAVGASSTVVVTLTPPASLQTIDVTGEITAEAPDPDANNNTVTLQVLNTRPVLDALLGGGFSCALAPHHAPSAGPGLAALTGLLGLALSLLPLRRRLRRARQREIT